MGRSARKGRRCGLRLEGLEDRIAPAGFVFIDYGDNFPLVGANRVLTTTIGALRDVADAPNANDKILGTTLTDSDGNSPAGTAVSVTRPGYSAAERAQMLGVIQRAYSALELTVVELTQTAQTLADGRVVAAASSMADIVNTLRGGNAAFRDAYILAASFIVDPGGTTQRLYNNGGGNSPSSPTLGVASDLATGANNHDDLALVFASGVGGNFTNTMNNISHEAGHLLGLQHAITNPSGTAAVNQFHQAEIMSYRNTNNTSSSMFTRYPMIRGDNNSPAMGTNPANYNDLGPRNTPAGQPTYHDQLAQDGNVGANPNFSYVTGTGAHDIITIARNGAVATVTVQAFTSANYTAATAITVPGFPGSTTYQYTIPLTRTILIHGGDGDDRFVIDADLGVAVEVDGMLGTDTLVVNGKNAASLNYTPDPTAPNGVDLLPGGGGMTNVVSFGGTLIAGGTTIRFRDFEVGGSVTVQNVTTVTFVTPNSADNLVLGGSAGQNRVSGTSGGVGVVPLVITAVAGLVVDTGTNDGGGTGADTVSVDIVSGPSTSLVINTGVGGDTVVVNGLGAGVTVPLQVNADGGTDTLRVLNTTVSYTPDGTLQPDRGTLTAYGGKTIQFTGFEFVTPVSPEITAVGLDQAIINEDGTVTLSGQFLDPGSLSSHTVTIVWGDGSSDQFSLPIGNRSFTRSHRYLDDNPTATPQDNYPISVTITDNDNLADSANTQVTVRNVAPALTALAATAIDEGDLTTLTGTFFDPGTRDSHTVAVDWDDPNAAADSAFALSATHLLVVGQLFASSTDDGVLEILAVDAATQVVSFRVRHRYLDDGPAPGNGTAQDLSDVRVTITDDDTGSDTSTTSVLVHNVAPVITSHDNSAPSDSPVGENETILISGSFTDVGALDLHTVMIHWGDGTVEPGTVDQVTRTFAGAHAYAAGGIYTVTITLGDDDTGVATVVETVFVTGAGVQTIDGKQVLFVVGSAGADQVTINQVGKRALKVHADFLSDRGGQRTFDLPIDEIRVVLLGGDDHATIAGNVAIAALLDGGDGDDHLNGGGAGSVLSGGDGDDTLIGGSDNDILIGGQGRDRQVGGGGEDILIGGMTAFTDGPDDAILLNQLALFEILAEWNSARSATARRDNIGGVANPNFGDRLNGGHFLQWNITVTDDADADVLTGGSGGNWFFVFAGDVPTDLNPRRGDVKAE